MIRTEFEAKKVLAENSQHAIINQQLLHGITFLQLQSASLFRVTLYTAPDACVG